MQTAPLDKRRADELRVYARRRQTPLTLRQLYEFGYAQDEKTLLTAAQFLQNELPKRLASMALALGAMPCGLADMPSVRRIRAMYEESFRDLVDFPHPQTPSDEASFCEMLDVIKRRHRYVVESLAMGLLELRRARSQDVCEEINDALNRFYTTRIGIRMLIGQHVALHERHEDWVGIICSRTSPAEVAMEASQDAANVCRMHYGMAPEVEIVGQTDLSFTYIPTHLHHMIFELMKNSMRAVVEVHGETETLPPIRVVIARGIEDIAIKVSDEGGGIPRSGIPRIWSYLYTTAAPPPDNGRSEVDPMAGYGFGLPIARLYARYFGGDLQIISMKGYGTDAYLHLNRLGTHEEVLPGEAAGQPASTRS